MMDKDGRETMVKNISLGKMEIVGFVKTVEFPATIGISGITIIRISRRLLRNLLSSQSRFSLYQWIMLLAYTYILP